MTIATNTTNVQKSFYWILLISLFTFSFIAGILGFKTYFILQGENYDWVRAVYRTLQLFTFEGGDLLGKVPWSLNVVRFTAPITTLMAALMAFLEIFRERWKRMKIAGMKNHVVIIGLGSKGMNILEESMLKKEKVLVIEVDPLNPNLASISPPRSRWLTGDVNNKNILKNARITKAKSVFLLMGDDTTQVNTCLNIYQLIKECDRNKENALICIMHLHKPEFLNTIRSHSIVKNTNDGLVLNVFNVYENSAREMFEVNPPDLDGILHNSENFVQVVIFGFGKAGEALAMQTALTGHYLNGKKPKILVVDRMADTLVSDFLKRYPTFKDFCDVDVLPTEANSPQLIHDLVKRIDIENALNTLVLCFDNKTQNLLLGLQMDNMKLSKSEFPPQVLIRTNDNESLGVVSTNIKPYGLSSKVCSRKTIFEGELDTRAKAIHASFLEKRKKGIDFGTKTTDVDWEELSLEFQDSNRKAADHIGIKIRGIGCEIVALNDPREEAVFSYEELEQLSELEHRRWNAERSLAGWTYGVIKNEKIRQTPYLTDWNNLSDEIKGYDQEAVENISHVLGIVGLKFVRRLK